MSHDWFCVCGHDIFSHSHNKLQPCQFCDCKEYRGKRPEPLFSEPEPFTRTAPLKKWKPKPYYKRKEQR